MTYNMKDLRLHTLRGDIQTCLMDGMSKKGCWNLLYNRYVHGVEIPITREEFISVLDEQCRKAEDWFRQ